MRIVLQQASVRSAWPSALWISFILPAAILVVPGHARAERTSVDRIVAVIDNEIITEQELVHQAKPALEQMAQDANQTQRQAVLRQVLDQAIGERLIEREIRDSQDKLGVGEKDIDKAVDEVMQQNHLSREQLQSALYGQGLTWSEYRAKLRTQIERARLLQYKVQGKIQVKDHDVLRRCQQRQRLGSGQIAVCASHILLTLAKDATAEDIQKTRARAERMQQELSRGADFSTFVARYSDDHGNQDGQLGCFERGEMVEAFEKAAFSLPVDGISDVVTTEFGLHIIKVTDRRAASAQPCDSDAALEPFRQELFQEEMQQQMQTFIEELRQKAFVEVHF